MSTRPSSEPVDVDHSLELADPARAPWPPRRRLWDLGNDARPARACTGLLAGRGGTL
jgi:hypothetical protein